MKLNDEVYAFIEQVYPECADGIMQQAPDLSELDELFTSLEEIYGQRERYDLHWVLRDTQERFNRIYAKLKSGVQQNMDSNDLVGQMRELLGIENRQLATIRRTSQLFGLLSFLVSFIDIVISVALILLISTIAHWAQLHISSLLLVLIFVGLVALLKVTLDRFLIIPAVNRWGWRRFRRAVRVFKRISVVSTGCWMAVNYGRSSERRSALDLLKRGIEAAKKH